MIGITKYDFKERTYQVALAIKWILVAVNLVLFYVTFQYAAYITLASDNYVIYGFYVKWFSQSYLGFVIACWVSAAVFSVVTWRSMAAPVSVLQVVILAATPATFCLVFRELIYAMI